MTKSLTLVALFTFATTAAAEPVDMTGLLCRHDVRFGATLTWEFYGDVAIRYFSDGGVASLRRVGKGAYERYDRQGEWAAIYLFFDVGDGLQVRALSRPGLIQREKNRASPLELAVVPFNADCSSLW